MAKGAIAKEQIANKLAELFGEDWIGEVDKKYYLWTIENGERIQIAISMTCPKNYATAAAPAASTPATLAPKPAEEGFDWDDAPQTAAPQITEDEKANIKKLMEQLGL